MKRKFIITETQYKKILKEYFEKIDDDEEEDLKYTHPVSGKECKIKIAKNNFTDRSWGQYSAVLVCDLYDDGAESIIATLPVTGNNPQEVKKIVCRNIEKVFDMLDEMLSEDFDLELNENENNDRWTIIDEPINCNI